MSSVSNKDVELVESVHFARLLNRLLALREIRGTRISTEILRLSVDSKARARMAGIVNKVFFVIQYYHFSNLRLIVITLS